MHVCLRTRVKDPISIAQQVRDLLMMMMMQCMCIPIYIKGRPNVPCAVRQIRPSVDILLSVGCQSSEILSRDRCMRDPNNQFGWPLHRPSNERVRRQIPRWWWRSHVVCSANPARNINIWSLQIGTTAPDLLTSQYIFRAPIRFSSSK